MLTATPAASRRRPALGVPCFTLRDRTERPITVELGTNTVLGLAPERILEIPRLLREADGRPARVPPLWDGASAGRVVDVLLRFLDAGRAVRTRQ